MIASLRRKVFWSILLSAAGVLLVILVAINALQLSQTASKKESILDTADMLLRPDAGPGEEFKTVPAGEPGANPAGEFGTDSGPGPRRDDKAALLRSVSEDELGILLLDKEGTILNQSGCAATLDAGILQAVIHAALADADGRGRAEGWEYKAIPIGDGTGISILDAAALRRENRDTILLSLGAFAAACCLFALLARLLSRLIVKPVEENLEAQKRFVADASHELKTPLAVIDANASVLEQSIGENKWLDYIKEQSGRMAGLVAQLLQLSHLEEEKTAETPQTPESFDAAEVVMGAALPFESLAFEKGLALETRLPESLPMQGNRADLEQLATILIDNAVKHASGDGQVLVSLERQARRNRREEGVLALQVSNPGEDIPAEALPHIFDRFYRIDAARSHQGGSYGLGLAIAKGLAEKNKGSIAVSSREGLTAFTVLLPLESE